VWLDGTGAYGDLAGDPRFAAPFTAALNRVWRDGTRAAIRAYLG
jgi:mannitol 2-dehydrogenase